MASHNGRIKVSREPRRQLNNRPAWITVDDGLTERECAVVDVSPGGAKIVTEVEFSVKDRLALTLLADHSRRHACEVVWRRGKTYGLRFVMAEPVAEPAEAASEPAGVE
ncbi:PilZ domain-containing protein [Bradyrhizobium jicamae]|uniref:PilZ domain-containing protein n=1 Tax=Bradyrhizobium jicamae TaxID=280332 RepID=A0ABS5FLV7_9BRAD|nr:PilZ domain-containing protein [Bradyrhizobium jicamae]MBR0797762.1 PilZ domain-containing protein [Bradyrhizobium jicamae]MBR0933303.1 PilZ domain-containing protein [Bradyrhizobium jicamae]